MAAAIDRDILTVTLLAASGGSLRDAKARHPHLEPHRVI
jgi:hypothetical protein